MVCILVVSNNGREELIDFNPDHDLAHIIKSYRTPENRWYVLSRMVSAFFVGIAVMLPVQKITGVR